MAGPHGRYTKGITVARQTKDALTGQIRGGHAGGRTTRSPGAADTGTGNRRLVPLVTITNVTQANPAVITRNAHPFRVGMDVKFSRIAGMDEINGLVACITAVTTNTFTVNIDASGFSGYSGEIGQVHRVPTKHYPTGFNDTDLPGD